MRKNTLLLLLMLCLQSVAYAQKVHIRSFKLDQTDVSAVVNTVLDNNGERCALVKVRVPVAGATFEGDIIGETLYIAGEYYVWMAEGASFLDIAIPNRDKIEIDFRSYEGVGRLRGKMTYHLLDNPEWRIWSQCSSCLLRITSL